MFEPWQGVFQRLPACRAGPVYYTQHSWTLSYFACCCHALPMVQVTNLRAEVAELQKKVDLPGSPSARSLPKMKTPPRLQVVLEN